MKNTHCEQVTKDIENEIFKNELDLNIDYADLAIENIAENEALKHIPVVKTLFAFYNITTSFIARHNIKKLLVFLNGLHSNNVNPKKLLEFKQKFHGEPKHREQVLETIMVLNEKFIDSKQSKVFANLFKAHIEGFINWPEFNNLAIILNSLHPLGYDFLEQMSKEQQWSNHGRDEEGEAFMFACGIGHRHGSKFTITKSGQRLYEFGIKPSRFNALNLNI